MLLYPHCQGQYSYWHHSPETLFQDFRPWEKLQLHKCKFTINFFVFDIANKLLTRHSSFAPLCQVGEWMARHSPSQSEVVCRNFCFMILHREYMVACRKIISLLVFNLISHEWAQWNSIFTCTRFHVLSSMWYYMTKIATKLHSDVTTDVIFLSWAFYR